MEADEDKFLKLFRKFILMTFYRLSMKVNIV
jgi:hypothetical protein